MAVMNRSSTTSMGNTSASLIKKKKKKENSFYSKEDGCWLKPSDPLGESKTD